MWNYKGQDGCHNCIHKKEDTTRLFCGQDFTMPLGSGQRLMEWEDTHEVDAWGICSYYHK